MVPDDDDPGALNPAESDQYVIYADVEEPEQCWVGQRAGGRYAGWECNADVADWPEVESCGFRTSL